MVQLKNNCPKSYISFRSHLNNFLENQGGISVLFHSLKYMLNNMDKGIKYIWPYFESNL